MTNKNQDLRVTRTRQAIRKAIAELIEEKGFEAVTVKDITTRAGINRGTFYAHYEDKYDLMNKCQEEIMLGLSEIAQKNIPKVYEQVNQYPGGSFSLIIGIFQYIEHHKDFLKAILGPKGDLSFQTKVKKFMFKKLFDDPNGPLIKEDQLLVPREYLISYIASAHIGVLQQWLLGDKNETPEEIAHILSTITLNGPFYAAGIKKQ
ncbi:TetR/AcrR family transcriptional regulator [Cytobacillus sp. FSL W7-1323]|uniref:TetR family transcriptional regulator n=1 Tax=Cytobacillus kochii TaxID=859143 RepID=A0A248TFN6_9BACI|nr:TetR/AcrR family transcriptional regulator [Cytobacillus kochii]ASV66932.1 TetR family transcriptional regulator [Cytobacillus kochii]MDQ0185163.1 AcrR family transcriptional regulator [Cytobacillus kochii]MED1605267.1 TetR/AcrR family transcriptional regulator [Cytobacillus kochii]